MKKITLEINEDILAGAEAVLEHIGLDVETAFKMFLKKVSNDGSISFLLSNNSGAEGDTAKASETDGEKAITKSIAKRMFAQKGYATAKEIRYSKRNRATHNFWQNFDVLLFDEDLSIILNDQLNRVLYLFDIPAKSINPDCLVKRADIPGMVDLQICGNDPTFTDTKSGVRFDKFLIYNINY